MQFSPDSSGTSYVSIYVITAIGLARTRLDEIEKIRNDENRKFETEQRALSYQQWTRKKWWFFNKNHNQTFEEEFAVFLDECKNYEEFRWVYPSLAHNTQYKLCKSIINAASLSTLQSMWVSRQDMELLNRVAEN